MGAKFTGMTEAKRGFRRVRRSVPEQVDDAVRRHTGAVLAETQVRVPKDTNRLAMTALAHGVTKDPTPRTKSSWRLVYGEAGEGEGIVDYAAAVHEILGAFHAPPTQAKFVEQPLIESIPQAERTIERAVKDGIREAFTG